MSAKIHDGWPKYGNVADPGSIGTPESLHPQVLSSARFSAVRNGAAA